MRDPGHRIEAMLAAVDWSSVKYSLGTADEFPQRVHDLWDPDVERRRSAIWYLRETGFRRAVSSQATVQMTPVVVALLGDRRVEGVWYYTLFEKRLPVRAGLLECLGYAANSAFNGGTSDELRRKAALLAAGRGAELVRAGLPGSIADLVAAEQAPYRIWVREHADDLLDVSLPWLDDPDPRMAQAAVYPVARCGMIASAGHRHTAQQRLLKLAQTPDGHQAVQGTAVLELLALGVDTTPLLEHPSLPVRAIAALSPATADNPRSLTALEHALRQAPQADDWLAPSPPMLDTRLTVQFANVAADRARTFDDLLPGAFAAASAGVGWQSLLPVAFPPGWLDRPLSAAQREFLQRVVDNDVNWHPVYTEWMDTLRSVGLPADRDACRRLLA